MRQKSPAAQTYIYKFGRKKCWHLECEKKKYLCWLYCHFKISIRPDFLNLCYTQRLMFDTMVRKKWVYTYSIRECILLPGKSPVYCLNCKIALATFKEINTEHHLISTIHTLPPCPLFSNLTTDHEISVLFDAFSSRNHSIILTLHVV